MGVGSEKSEEATLFDDDDDDDDDQLTFLSLRFPLPSPTTTGTTSAPATGCTWSTRPTSRRTASTRGCATTLSCLPRTRSGSTRSSSAARGWLSETKIRLRSSCGLWATRPATGQVRVLERIAGREREGSGRLGKREGEGKLVALVSPLTRNFCSKKKIEILQRTSPWPALSASATSRGLSSTKAEVAARVRRTSSVQCTRASIRSSALRKKATKRGLSSSASTRTPWETPTATTPSTGTRSKSTPRCR